jgi:DNA-binding LacI/PurR family transcriptional regulator
VRIDDVETALTAVRHLIGLGHTRIAHLHGVPDPEHAGLDFSAPGDRLVGYRMAMEEAGLPIEPGWEVTGDFTAHGGLTACRQLLTARTRPTAIFAGSDEMAIGASRAIREAGLSVPDDISVIGVDNHELSEYFDLTTMAQPAPALGRLGARMLLDALHADTRPPPVETIVPTQLIVRGTTARVS